METDLATSYRMSRVPSRDTTPELAVRALVRQCGAAYRLNNPDLPGSPDLANRSKRWAIFVHGCFWHSHEGCRRATIPDRNREFWTKKLVRNRERDRQALQELAARGYSVLVVWECQLTNPASVRGRIANTVLAQQIVPSKP